MSEDLVKKLREALEHAATTNHVFKTCLCEKCVAYRKFYKVPS